MPDRFLAWIGSLTGNFAVFGAILGSWPGLPPTTIIHGYPEPSRILDLGSFKPYVVDAARYDLRDAGPDCPKPRTRPGAFDLAFAPLPLSFDPYAYPDRLLTACVRLSEGGAPLGVALIGVPDRAIAAELTRKIRTDWYFRRDWEFSRDDPRDESGWLRVRLNVGPAPVNEPLMSY